MVVGEGGRSTGVLLYHKITEYGIKCRMHAHHVAPRAPPGRGELYRRRTLFLDDFPIFFYPNEAWTHPPIFVGIFGIFFNFAKPLSMFTFNCVKCCKNSSLPQSVQKSWHVSAVLVKMPLKEDVIRKIEISQLK